MEITRHLVCDCGNRDEDTWRHDGLPPCSAGCGRTMREVSAADLRQSRPTVNDGPCVQDLVIADIRTRKALGLKKYGTVLQPFNGRDALVSCHTPSPTGPRVNELMPVFGN